MEIFSINISTQKSGADSRWSAISVVKKFGRLLQRPILFLAYFKCKRPACIFLLWKGNRDGRQCKFAKGRRCKTR